METACHMGVVSLCVLQVQTLYYSADHKLLDGALIIEEHGVFGVGAEDHIQFVQVHNPPLSWANSVSLVPTWPLSTLCSLATRAQPVSVGNLGTLHLLA